jgi:hypothetical protein
MGVFWKVLHEIALADASATGTPLVVVSHQELASGGVAAGRALAAALGLPWTAAMADELSKESGGATGSPERLHNFDRAPAQVAEEWRTRLTDDEVHRIEALTEETMGRLAQARLPLGG